MNIGRKLNFSSYSQGVIARLVCTATVVLLAGTGSAFAQSKHPYCQSSDSDSDGDGWGWENDKSCIVTGSPADKVVPVVSNCPRDQIDTDGDGFGWHNGKSCRVLPTCAAASSDPDGDGYGWENDATCVVRAYSQPETEVGSDEEFGKCQLPDSDADGDGYGYENGQTCVAEVTPATPEITPGTDSPAGHPACVNNDSDPDGDGFGFENGGTCVVEFSKTVSTVSLADVTEVIVITGQSNALGSETEFDGVLDAPHERAFAYTDNGWQIADLHLVWDDNKHPGNGSLEDSSRRPYNNLAFQFAKSVASKSPTRVPAFIVDADPGKGIANWDYNSSFYRKLNSKINKALSAMPHKSSVDAILWHQGENDWLYEGTSDPGATGFTSKDSNEYKNYYAIKLANLINNFRNESWARSDTLFICGETRRATGVNRRLMALNSDGDPSTGCVPATDLPARPDDTAGSHFSGAGLRTLGQRYADKYLEMNGG